MEMQKYYFFLKIKTILVTLQNNTQEKSNHNNLTFNRMKKTPMIVAATAIMLSACNSSINDAEIKADVHRIVAKTEQCYANVHNDLIDSMDVDFFNACNDELDMMMADIDKKYSDEKDRRKFDSTFMVEIQNSELDNDLISLMLEIYGMNFEE